jgi:hypothetical protein
MASLTFFTIIIPGTPSWWKRGNPSGLKTRVRTLRSVHPPFRMSWPVTRGPHTVCDSCEDFVSQWWTRLKIAPWYSAGLRDGWLGGSIPGWEFSLHHRLHTGSGAHPASYTMNTRGSFSGVKRPGREAYRPPPSSAEVKNAWSYTSPPQIRLHGVVLTSKNAQDNFTFTRETSADIDRNFISVIYNRRQVLLGR